MNDFMDFNGDGRVDTGEEFIGYQIYKDVTDGSGQHSPRATSHGKVDGFDIFIICLIAFEVLKMIASCIYG